MENYEKFEKEVEDLEVIDDESVDEPMKMTEEEVIAKLLAEDELPAKSAFIAVCFLCVCFLCGGCLSEHLPFDYFLYII